jgi:hypothetical protein
MALSFLAPPQYAKEDITVLVVHAAAAATFQLSVIHRLVFLPHNSSFLAALLTYNDKPFSWVKDATRLQSALHHTPCPDDNTLSGCYQLPWG